MGLHSPAGTEEGSEGGMETIGVPMGVADAEEDKISAALFP
jgi:hypothetical protein